MLVVDYRRNDLRTNVLESKYWISSKIVYGTEVAAAGKSCTITGAGIAAVSGSPDSLTDSGNGFVTAGFLAGDPIYVSGFTGAGVTANLGFFDLAAGGVAAGTLTFEAADTTLASDAAGETVTVITPKANVLFSFPVAGMRTLVREIVVEIITGFTAGTKIVIGSGTLATDAITTGGIITNVACDTFVLSADITAATIGFYSSVLSAWGLLGATRSYTSPRYITGAATATPVVYAAIANAATIAAGAMRLHMLVTNVPTAAA
jgi:hypothetical protein